MISVSIPFVLLEQRAPRVTTPHNTLTSNTALKPTLWARGARKERETARKGLGAKKRVYNTFTCSIITTENFSKLKNICLFFFLSIIQSKLITILGLG